MAVWSWSGTRARRKAARSPLGQCAARRGGSGTGATGPPLRALCRRLQRVCAQSPRGGEQVLAGLTKLYDRLHLKVNEAKSAVARPRAGSFWAIPSGMVRRAGPVQVADKAKRPSSNASGKWSRRSGGRSLPEIVERLRTCLPGWKGYFQLAQTPKVFCADSMSGSATGCVRCSSSTGVGARRCIGNLKALGAPETDARQVAANSRRWWRNSRFLLNRACRCLL